MCNQRSQVPRKLETFAKCPQEDRSDTSELAHRGSVVAHACEHTKKRDLPLAPKRRNSRTETVKLISPRSLFPSSQKPSFLLPKERKPD